MFKQVHDVPELLLLSLCSQPPKVCLTGKVSALASEDQDDDNSYEQCKIAALQETSGVNDWLVHLSLVMFSTEHSTGEQNSMTSSTLHICVGNIALPNKRSATGWFSVMDEMMRWVCGSEGSSRA